MTRPLVPCPFVYETTTKELIGIIPYEFKHAIDGYKYVLAFTYPTGWTMYKGEYRGCDANWCRHFYREFPDAPDVVSNINFAVLDWFTTDRRIGLYDYELVVDPKEIMKRAIKNYLLGGNNDIAVAWRRYTEARYGQAGMYSTRRIGGMFG